MVEVSSKEKVRGLWGLFAVRHKKRQDRYTEFTFDVQHAALSVPDIVCLAHSDESLQPIKMQCAFERYCTTSLLRVSFSLGLSTQ